MPGTLPTPTRPPRLRRRNRGAVADALAHRAGRCAPGSTRAGERRGRSARGAHCRRSPRARRCSRGLRRVAVGRPHRLLDVCPRAARTDGGHCSRLGASRRRLAADRGRSERADPDLRSGQCADHLSPSPARAGRHDGGRARPRLRPLARRRPQDRARNRKAATLRSRPRSGRRPARRLRLRPRLRPRPATTHSRRTARSPHGRRRPVLSPRTHSSATLSPVFRPAWMSASPTGPPFSRTAPAAPRSLRHRSAAGPGASQSHPPPPRPSPRWAWRSRDSP